MGVLRTKKKIMKQNKSNSAKKAAPEKKAAAQTTHSQPASYSMLDPRFRRLYFQFYRETYKHSKIDRKTKELISIAASLVAHCQGCLEGHIQKAIKLGATREEIGETIAIAIGISGAAMVDQTDAAARQLNLALFETAASEPTDEEQRVKGA
jgi:AhpD family alkylhydroperoxidase